MSDSIDASSTAVQLTQIHVHQLFAVACEVYNGRAFATACLCVVAREPPQR